MVIETEKKRKQLQTIKYLNNKSNMKVIFIGGTGSSGTRVIRDILLTHSSTYGINEEIRFICDPDGLLDLIDCYTNNWTPYNAEIALRRFIYIMKCCFGENILDKQRNILYRMGINPHKYSYLNLSKAINMNNNTASRIVDVFINQIRLSISDSYWFGSPKFEKRSFYETRYLDKEKINIASIEMIKNFLRHYSGYSDNKFWVENTPFNLIQAHRLIKLFPNMKLLHVYREPKDVISSFKYRNYGSNSDITNAKRLLNIWKRWIDVKKVLPINSFIEFNLRDIVNDQEKMSKIICNFAGFNFEEDMLTVNLNKSNYGRWRNDIDSVNLGKVNKIFKPVYKEIDKLDSINKKWS